jgi:hypothetical protein
MEQGGRALLLFPTVFLHLSFLALLLPLFPSDRILCSQESIRDLRKIESWG